MMEKHNGNNRENSLIGWILSLNTWVFSLILLSLFILILLFSDIVCIICTTFVGISLFGLLGTWSKIHGYGWKYDFNLILGAKWTLIFFIIGLISFCVSLIKIYW